MPGGWSAHPAASSSDPASAFGVPFTVCGSDLAVDLMDVPLIQRLASATAARTLPALAGVPAGSS
jgi:hypothetical protein